MHSLYLRVDFCNFIMLACLVTWQIYQSHDIHMLVYSRYSDFIVHELALDGSVVKLTDLSLPQESAGDVQVQYSLQSHSQASPPSWNETMRSRGLELTYCFNFLCCVLAGYKGQFRKCVLSWWGGQVAEVVRERRWNKSCGREGEYVVSRTLCSV